MRYTVIATPGETAFHHRATGVTLVTDTLVAVREWPFRGGLDSSPTTGGATVTRRGEETRSLPRRVISTKGAILADDPRPLLYHARDDAREVSRRLLFLGFRFVVWLEINKS